MTSSRMGRLYVEEARGRLALVHLALERGLWTAAVREAQECVELFLKGALRLVAVEPARTHDVAAILRSEAGRFPEWFRSAVDTLATISTELASDRGGEIHNFALSAASGLWNPRPSRTAYRCPAWGGRVSVVSIDLGWGDRLNRPHEEVRRVFQANPTLGGTRVYTAAVL